MLKREHCALCENHLFSLEKGIYCFLTDEQLAFEDRCEFMIVYGNAKKAIEEIDSEIIVLRKQRRIKRISFIAASILGLTIMIIAYNFTSYLFNLGRVNIETLVLGGMGLVVFLRAALSLRKFNVELDEAIEKKENLDTVLRYYNIDYDTNVQIEKIHGEWEFKYDILFKNINNKIQLPVPIVAFQNFKNQSTK